MFFWFIFALVVVFFVWTAYVLRKRGPNFGGPTANDDRHRATRGGDIGG